MHLSNLPKKDVRCKKAENISYASFGKEKKNFSRNSAYIVSIYVRNVAETPGLNFLKTINGSSYPHDTKRLLSLLFYCPRKCILEQRLYHICLSLLKMVACCLPPKLCIELFYFVFCSLSR